MNAITRTRHLPQRRLQAPGSCSALVTQCTVPRTPAVASATSEYLRYNNRTTGSFRELQNAYAWTPSDPIFKPFSALAIRVVLLEQSYPPRQLTTKLSMTEGHVQRF